MSEVVNLNGWVDSHCHLADPRIVSQAAFILARAQTHGIQHFLMAGVDPADWQQQESLYQQYPQQLWPSYGVHPYFVAKSTWSETEKALHLLREWAPKGFALGEVGLDFRSTISQGNTTLQQKAYNIQLAMAVDLKKTVILHVVRAHPLALKELKAYNHEQLRGMVHAFNGDIKTAEAYVDRGFYLSIGSAVLFAKNQPLRKAVAEIPLNFLLLESDAPDQPPPSIGSGQNEPWTVSLVASQIASIRGMERDEVLQVAQTNFVNLFAKEIADFKRGMK